MIIIFTEGSGETRKIINFSVQKKWLCYSIIAEFDSSIEFYNYKSKEYESKFKVKISPRGWRCLFQFYKMPITEVYIISIESDIILDIAELVPNKS